MRKRKKTAAYYFPLPLLLLLLPTFHKLRSSHALVELSWTVSLVREVVDCYRQGPGYLSHAVNLALSYP